MSTPSFKQMIKDGQAKRADAMKFRIEDIHEEPGFNLRDEAAMDADGVSFEESIAALAAHIVEGGIVPPLEVRPRDGGGVFVVDGHRRRLAYLSVADRLRDPSGELWIPVVPFSGNDAERTARIITSQQGRRLVPLEIARGYDRLIRYGWSVDQIAARVGKTRQHVDQMLLLARANSDVQAMVNAGDVAASTAIKAVRKHGEEAGPVLTGAVATAKANGKTRATVSALSGKAPSGKLVARLAAAASGIARSLPQGEQASLASMETVSVRADLIRELLAACEAIDSRRAEVRS